MYRESDNIQYVRLCSEAPHMSWGALVSELEKRGWCVVLQHGEIKLYPPQSP